MPTKKNRCLFPNNFFYIKTLRVVILRLFFSVKRSPRRLKFVKNYKWLHHYETYNQAVSRGSNSISWSHQKNNKKMLRRIPVRELRLDHVIRKWTAGRWVTRGKKIKEDWILGWNLVIRYGSELNWFLKKTLQRSWYWRKAASLGREFCGAGLLRKVIERSRKNDKCQHWSIRIKGFPVLNIYMKQKVPPFIIEELRLMVVKN